VKKSMKHLPSLRTHKRMKKRKVQFDRRCDSAPGSQRDRIIKVCVELLEDRNGFHYSVVMGEKEKQREKLFSLAPFIAIEGNPESLLLKKTAGTHSEEPNDLRDTWKREVENLATHGVSEGEKEQTRVESSGPCGRRRSGGKGYGRFQTWNGGRRKKTENKIWASKNWSDSSVGLGSREEGKQPPWLRRPRQASRPTQGS